VLETLLAGLSEGSDQPEKRTIYQDDLDFEADFGGLSLKELATSQPPDTTISDNRKPKTTEESRYCAPREFEPSTNL